MKLLAILLLLCVSQLAFSQKTKLIKHTIDRTEKEQYYVLKSNTAIRHGEYTRYEFKNLAEKGFYDNGKKTGTWETYGWKRLETTTEYLDGKKEGEYRSYHWGIKMLKEQGFYKNDQKDSTWTTYDQEGQIVASENWQNGKRVGIASYYLKNELKYRYDYTSNRQLFAADTTTYEVVLDSDTIESKLENPPFYEGGLTALRKVIAENTTYPDAAMEHEISAKVIVWFTITPDGSITNVHVREKKGYGLDEEAIRVVRLLEKYIPAHYQGKPVAVMMKMPIIFKTL